MSLVFYQYSRLCLASYGFFYGAIALFSSLGALSIGYIWKYFGQSEALVFSLLGMSIVFMVSLFKLKNIPGSAIIK